MTDALFLEEVAVFLRRADEPAESGLELVRALDKDAALLSLDALQLLEAARADSDGAASEGATSAESPPREEPESVRSRDAIRRSTYRQKQKAHRDALQRQVAQLSAELAALQQRRAAAEAREGLGLAQTAVWKALASRHLQARLLAEEQRRRLHEAIEKRSALIRDLGAIVRKRIAEDLPDEVGFATKKPRAESPDMALYEAYISELDDIYARTESVFKETVMPFDENCEETPGFYNKSRQIVRDSSFHELVGTSTTPFAYGRVHEYIGRICCMDNRPGREKIEGDWIPDNTTIVKARIGVPALGGFLVQHSITRKYNEGSRVIIVWRKFTEGEGAFAGMHSDETGWNIVRPSPSCGGGSTLLESVTRFVPMNFSTATASGATVMKQFADTIIKTGEQDCQECIQMLEKMLLDDAIGVCSRTSNSYR